MHFTVSRYMPMISASARSYLGHVHLAFDRQRDNVGLSRVTEPPGHGQINKLGAPAIDGCGSLLDSPRPLDGWKFDERPQHPLPQNVVYRGHI
jgi:hypothetical protein